MYSHEDMSTFLKEEGKFAKISMIIKVKKKMWLKERKNEKDSRIFQNLQYSHHSSPLARSMFQQVPKTAVTL